ncbi:MAG: hypothetical protein IPM56_03175 [Ignavibacteriales bacterium]|nr:MAG: hypothetical protein IPM56_03175 [Ignavibacteriales bacterium]
MKYEITIFLILVFITGCTPTKEVMILKEFNGDGVAVINFSTQGSFVESSIGKNAADRLTDAFFLKRNLRVIDRSKINDVLIDMEIKTPETLSKEQLLKIGQRLNANYVVLGRIIQTSESNLISTTSYMGLYISFRIISTANSDVVGMASYSTTYKSDLFKEIDQAMIKLAEEIEL